MRRFYLYLIFQIAFSSILLGQSSLDLTTFNESRLKLQRNSMLVLGTWAVGNIAVGSIMAGHTIGVEKQFHIMNAGWNIINLGLAGIGYYSATTTDPTSLDIYETIKAQQGIQKILLFNAGLDVGYMVGGFYLMERSKNTTKNQDRLKGFGRSILLQGGFLFVFDLCTYFLHQSHDSEIKNLLSNLTFNGQQVGLFFHF